MKSSVIRLVLTMRNSGPLPPVAVAAALGASAGTLFLTVGAGGIGMGRFTSPVTMFGMRGSRSSFSTLEKAACLMASSTFTASVGAGFRGVVAIGIPAGRPGSGSPPGAVGTGFRSGNGTGIGDGAMASMAGMGGLAVLWPGSALQAA